MNSLMFWAIIYCTGNVCIQDSTIYNTKLQCKKALKDLHKDTKEALYCVKFRRKAV